MMQPELPALSVRERMIDEAVAATFPRGLQGLRRDGGRVDEIALAATAFAWADEIRDRFRRLSEAA